MSILILTGTDRYFLGRGRLGDPGLTGGGVRAVRGPSSLTGGSLAILYVQLAEPKSQGQELLVSVTGLLREIYCDVDPLSFVQVETMRAGLGKELADLNMSQEAGNDGVRPHWRVSDPCSVLFQRGVKSEARERWEGSMEEGHNDCPFNLLQKPEEAGIVPLATGLRGQLPCCIEREVPDLYLALH
ncbi:hypothetical protein NDU88_002752 [Pleurodeles waltl]|uniref:Uncharacterized protein n=1 Tax=Pleurodeles waltl TaxID=8319 RepID=A0AAV7WPH8_PLEWA|nr:hypothetical protein NDU88_002752 [Pleurodeles waltl]